MCVCRSLTSALSVSWLPQRGANELKEQHEKKGAARTETTKMHHFVLMLT